MGYQYGFIGGGNMATALIGGIIGGSICAPEQVVVSDISNERLTQLADQFSVSTTPDNTVTTSQSACVILAVKPQTFDALALEIASHLLPDTIIISILAGKNSIKLSTGLGYPMHLVRVMPNLPALIGQGVTAIAETDNLTDKARQAAQTLFSTVGTTLCVPEALMDSVTAVSGSGPGYIFRIAETLVQGAIELGFEEQAATELVIQTLAGAALMLAERKDPPADLCRRVCSPGGTTLAGLDAMRSEGLEQALLAGLRAARDRSHQLSK
jgi:pyrroline-5-carboxylate reductase